MSFKDIRIKIKKYKTKHPFVFYFLIVYLSGLLLYSLTYMIWYADHQALMPLNEVGDFLAGAFSPIAFLFLYLGYQQNSDALKFQVTELRNSTKALKDQVEQQTEQVRISTEHLDYYRQKDLNEKDKELLLAKPTLILERTGSGTSGDKFTIKNIGGDAKHIVSDRPKVSIPILCKNSKTYFETPYTVDFLELEYKDVYGNIHRTQFTKGNERLSKYTSQDI